MAFGLFKKKDTGADSIYVGGRIFTQDPNNEWVTAVACKNGRIIAVGDDESIMDLEGEETVVVDLEEEYMFPGLIDPSGHPALAVFKKCSLMIEAGASLETIIMKLTGYIQATPEADAYFAYGFSTAILEGKTLEEAASMLDQLNCPAPIVLLSESGGSVWLNTVAIEAVKESAEKDKTPDITVPYILYVLAPFDHQALEIETLALAEKYRSLGFTSVLSCGEPDYLQNVYQQCLVDMYQCGTLLQRFFGALLVASNVSAKGLIHRLLQKKTSCMELDDIFNYNMLKLIVDSTGADPSISDDTLIELCNAAGDNGFDIHIDAIGSKALISSFNAISKMRGSGYRKNTVVLAHAENLAAINENSDNPIDFEALGIVASPPAIATPSDVIDSFNDFTRIHDLLDFYTIHAAEKLGFETQLGQITNGYYADFTVFKTNPLELEPKDFHKITVTMTVINGKPTTIGDMSMEDEFFDELEDFDADRVGLDGMRGLNNLGGIV